MSKRPIRRTSRRTLRGAVAVELALLSIPLILCTLAGIEFARIVFTYDQLVKVTRDGARYLSGFDPTIDSEYPDELAKTRMVYGAPSGPQPVVPGLTVDHIRICDRADSSACPSEVFANVPTGTGAINLVRVEIVGYTYQPLFPISGVFGPITFDTISTTMRQVL